MTEESMKIEQDDTVYDLSEECKNQSCVDCQLDPYCEKVDYSIPGLLWLIATGNPVPSSILGSEQKK